MKKLNKSSELMWILGTLLVALGVCICKKADLGVSMIAAPAFIVYEAVKNLWSAFSVGMVEYIIQGLLLIILCIAIRRFNWKYIFAFLVAIIYGYALDFWLLIFGDYAFELTAVRYIMLIVGDCITAIGVACFFRTYLPLQVYELFVAEFSGRYKLSINRTKLFFDLSCLTLSLLLAFTLFGDVTSFDWSTIFVSNFHNIGIGTIITTIINTPIITFAGKMLDKVFDYNPLFPKVKIFFKGENKTQSESPIQVENSIQIENTEKSNTTTENL